MATLVLTVAGAVVGGPAGAQLGMMVGQFVDKTILFKPKGRQGPRLDTLSVQTSSYGTPIPRIYGTMRVAGTVIWATELVESKKKSGGKGQPTVTNYSYASNFAVALSSRPIVAVRRIWADGKLLRGAAGDMKVAGSLRVHLGTEDQAVDPFIASAEGGEGAPAYRGLAYAVFEGLALAEFGNRIPMLTFEVEAAPAALLAIINDVSEGLIEAGIAQPLTGYAVGGESKRVALDLIAAPFGGWGAALPKGEDVEIAASDLGAHAQQEDDPPERILRRDRPAPSGVEIGYFDPARDYQAGQQSERSGKAEGPGIEIGLPAVLSAGDAKALAALALQRAEQGAVQLSLSLMPRWIKLAPGDELTIPVQPGRWRVVETMIEHGAVRVTLIPAPLAPPAPIEADPGRNLPSPDLLIGETTLHLLDLGYAAGPSEARYVAAAGGGPGWRRAPLLLSDGAGGAEPMGAAVDAALLGTIETPPAAASPLLFDRTSAFIIQLVNHDAMLADASDIRLLGGANAAMAGNEILQFGSAEPLGAGRWRLSQLLRGRRGTEGAIGTQVPGDRFILLDRDTLTPLPEATAGQSLGLIAAGIGDSDGAEAPEMLTAEAGLRPLPPVHLTAHWQADGSLRLGWTRQSRTAWVWIDGADAPLGEESERYRLMLEGQIIETSEPHWTIMAGDPLLSGSTLDWSVTQIGDFGLSDPATRSFPVA